MTAYRKLLRWLGGKLISWGGKLMSFGVRLTVPHDFIIIDDPSTHRPLTEAQHAKMMRWFEEDLTPRIANTNRKLH